MFDVPDGGGGGAGAPAGHCRIYIFIPKPKLKHKPVDPSQADFSCQKYSTFQKKLEKVPALQMPSWQNNKVTDRYHCSPLFVSAFPFLFVRRISQYLKSGLPTKSEDVE